MLAPCPHASCPNFATKDSVVRDGRFYRRCEARYIQRFRCRGCGKRFSHATGTLEFNQRKRRENAILRELLCASVSMRRSARILGIHRVTVQRKLAYLAKRARLSHNAFLSSLRGTVTHLQFDDLITSEHTKLKPLTVSLAVDGKRRYILGAQVEPIGAFGHLAVLSRKKYGRRPHRHLRGLQLLFERISPSVAGNALVQSDEHKTYPLVVAQFLPGREHRRHKGGRGAVVGQGELKKLKYDPLFILNHSCALLRANINRLVRRTWCTTKRPERLQQHLDVFIDYYNQSYL